MQQLSYCNIKSLESMQKQAIEPCESQQIIHRQQNNQNHSNRQNSASHQTQLPQSFINIKCLGKNDAKLLCLTQQCQEKSIFTCYDEKCQCQSSHQKCQKGLVQYAVKKIQQKILPTSQIRHQIQSIFNFIIDQLSQLKDRLLETIEQKLKFIQLSFIQKVFWSLGSKSENLELFTVRESQLLWKQIDEKFKDKSKTFEALRGELKNFKLRGKDNVNCLNKYVDQMLEQYKEQEKKLERMRKKLTQNQLEAAQKIVSTSNIVKQPYMAQRLIRFFQNSIKKIDLLYKASQNNFSMKKYFQQCGPALDTVIICQTDKSLLLGAFTPLCHQSDKDGYAQDPQKKSFIFSLTNDDKFQLRNQMQAIDRYSSKKCICFGDSQFLICQKSNTNKNCLTNINWNYRNDNYCDDDQASYKRLTGHETEHFLTKEWEVWKVQFET